MNATSCDARPVDYREYAPSAEHSSLVKAAWTLDVGDTGGHPVTHVATPDGCVEIIHRLAGQSTWASAQPPAFVAGLITAPAALHFSANARFIGLRIWPWAWNRLNSSCPAKSFINGWRDLSEVGRGIRPPGDVDGLFRLVPADLLPADEARFCAAVQTSSSVAGLAEVTGRPHRWIQRWFAREIGLPPRTYLRLIRFNDTFSALEGAEGTLADHAAAHGFADQAHMAREFRKMSGEPAVRARHKAQGPFLRGGLT